MLRTTRLKALAKAYSECDAYKAVAEQSGSLSGLKKLKFDKEYERDLSMYQAKRKKLTALLNGEKVTPKVWCSECDTLIAGGLRNSLKNRQFCGSMNVGKFT